MLFRSDDFADVVTLAHPDVSHRDVKLTTAVEVESAIRVPSAALRQVMLNMLLNGVSAAGEPGTVHAELRADADRVAFSLAHGGKTLTAEALHTTVAAESGDDPRGFGLGLPRDRNPVWRSLRRRRIAPTRHAPCLLDTQSRDP